MLQLATVMHAMLYYFIKSIYLRVNTQMDFVLTKENRLLRDLYQNQILNTAKKSRIIVKLI